MTKVLREMLKSGDDSVEMLIEVDAAVEEEESPRGFQNRSFSSGSRQSETPFLKGMQLIRGCAEKVSETVRGIPTDDRPREVEVTFGVKLTNKSEAVLARKGGEAQLEVTLKWSYENGSSHPPDGKSGD